MGIKHLRTILNSICVNKGVYNFATVDDFMVSEKMRLYKEKIKSLNYNNPIQQIRLKKNIINQPYFVAIDAYLYASRYKRVFKKIEYGFFRQIMLSLSCKMIPLYVFDGTAPISKRKTINQRQNKKNKNRNKLEKLLEEKILYNTDSTFQKDIDFEQNNFNDLNLDQLVNHINQLRNKLINNDTTSDECLVSILSDEKNEYTDSWNNLSRSLDESFYPEHNFSNNNNNLSSYLLHDSNDELNDEIIKLIKKSISIEYDDIKNLKTFLDLLKIPYITAKGEADDLMSILYKKGIINACQSDDMDMLPKGCGNLIQISKTGVSQYLLDDILNNIELTHLQFVDLCILLGSDYYTTYLPKIKPIDLLTIFKQHPSLEEFVKFYSNTDSKITNHLEFYKETRKLFLVLSEEFSYDIFLNKLTPLNFNNIKYYLSNVGINLDDFHDKKFRNMIKTINEFLSTIILV